jgi:hypothetical protein
MLHAHSTKGHAGITLWGDVYDLDRLHQYLHEANESAAITDKQSWFLELAYDVRSAKDGQRLHRVEAYDHENESRFFGVQILWPVVLLQTALFRESLAGLPSVSRRLQATTTEFECVVLGALAEVLDTERTERLYRQSRLAAGDPDHIAVMMDSRCRLWIAQMAKRRLRALPWVLESFGPFYDMLAGMSWRREMPGSLGPDDFAKFPDDGQDWPEFKW